eukprot:518107_1
MQSRIIFKAIAVIQINKTFTLLFETVMDVTNIRNVIWCCKRNKELISYPVAISKRLESCYHALVGSSKQCQVNEDNMVVFDTSGYYERNLSTNQSRVVFRVILWAYWDRNNEGKNFKEWQLFGLKECIEIEDSFHSQSL